MKEKEHEKNIPQKYEKPRVRTIELAAEQVLGSGCKNDYAPGPDADFCVLTQCLLEAS